MWEAFEFELPAVGQKPKSWLSPVRDAIYAAAPIQSPRKPDRIAGRFDTTPKSLFEDPICTEKDQETTSTTKSFASVETVAATVPISHRMNKWQILLQNVNSI